MCARITPVHPPLQVKALALLWAVQLAKRERWSHVFIEADSKICIDAILSGDKDQAGSISHIVSDIHDLASSFLSWSFYWVRRSCNQATHVAAKFALDSRISCFFFFFFFRATFPLRFLMFVRRTSSMFFSFS